MSHRKPQIGTVEVIKGMPEEGNPFRSVGKDTSILGPERVRILKQWISQGTVDGYTFWNMTLGTPPPNGRQIHSPDDVDWSTSCLDRYDENGRYIED